MSSTLRSTVVSRFVTAPPLPIAARAASASAAYSASVGGSPRVDGGGDVDPSSPEAFVRSIWPHAQRTAAELGVPAKALVAQAALETGWGRRLVGGDGSHNLFGIKATGWKGDRVRTGTHEYTNGVKHSETADFRAYNSPAESFADYVRLLKTSPRYQQALAAGKDIHGFAKGLQKAGYATDPSYANKIASIANGPTLSKVLSAMRSVASSALDTAVASSVGNTLRR